jgi:hypothetical protein
MSIGRPTYRCNRRARENNYDRTQIERCTNSVISTHILARHVFETSRETMLNSENFAAASRAAPESG